MVQRKISKETSLVSKIGKQTLYTTICLLTKKQQILKIYREKNKKVKFNLKSLGIYITISTTKQVIIKISKKQ